jgi:hypothetical protein
MSKKQITVFGATGAQGSSVLRSLSQNITTPFSLRGTTRNPTSTASKSLLEQVPDLDLIQADGWDKASMVAAFRDSWGAFLNTNSDDAVFENPNETRTEVDLGQIIVDAAIEAGVEVLVYSGFNSAKEITGGKVANPAFDGTCWLCHVAAKRSLIASTDKNAIGEYAKSTRAFKAVVIVGSGWYFENFLSRDLAPIFGGFPYIASEDGTFVLRVPKWGGKEEVPFIAIGDDFGDIVHGVFLEPEKLTGKLVQGVSDIESFDEVVAAFERGISQHRSFVMIIADIRSDRKESSFRGSGEVAGSRRVRHSRTCDCEAHVWFLSGV